MVRHSVSPAARRGNFARTDGSDGSRLGAVRLAYIVGVRWVPRCRAACAKVAPRSVLARARAPLTESADGAVQRWRSEKEGCCAWRGLCGRGRLILLEQNPSGRTSCALCQSSSSARPSRSSSPVGVRTLGLNSRPSTNPMVRRPTMEASTPGPSCPPTTRVMAATCSMRAPRARREAARSKASSAAPQVTVAAVSCSADRAHRPRPAAVVASRASAAGPRRASRRPRQTAP